MRAVKAVLNHYQGNTGKVVRVEEPQDVKKPPAPGARAAGGISLPEKLTSLLPKGLGELETEDIILLLMLYLMYRESGDSELLIIMGAMFLL